MGNYLFAPNLIFYTLVHFNRRFFMHKIQIHKFRAISAAPGDRPPLRSCLAAPFRADQHRCANRTKAQIQLCVNYSWKIFHLIYLRTPRIIPHFMFSRCFVLHLWANLFYISGAASCKPTSHTAEQFEDPAKA